MSTKLVCLFVVVSLFVSGCGQKKAEDPAFAVIDGWPLTPSYVKDLVLVQARISELRGQAIPQDQFARWANTHAMQAVPSLIASRLLEVELDRQSIQAESVDRQATVKSYGRLLNRTIRDEEELIGLFGSLTNVFRAQFEREARFRTFDRVKLPVVVTDAEVARTLRAATNRQNQAKQINAKAAKKAQEAWEKLKAGESWEQVAAAYNEDALNGKAFEDYWKIWGTFELKDFYLPQVAMALPRVRKGGFTKPLDTDDGLLIVKVLDNANGAYTLARILIRTAYPVAIPTPADVRKQLMQANQQCLQMDTLAELRNRATITYPMGTNFVYRIWPDPDSKD